jgi:hypothetical protein
MHERFLYLLASFANVRIWNEWNDALCCHSPLDVPRAGISKGEKSQTNLYSEESNYFIETS